MNAQKITLDQFANAYVTCALRASELDEYTVDDIHPDTLAKMTTDCKDFANELSQRLFDAVTLLDGWEQAGHDFSLTRNGHGAGFWDGDWPDDIGRMLTEEADTYGEFTLYVGDDGKIHH